MSLFSGPSEHAANPPETWKVVKVADRVWQLQTQAGDVLDAYPSKTRAEDERTPGHFFANEYAKEGRWYAGEPVHGWKPWAVVKAEREAVVRRTAARGRAGLAARIDRLTAQLRSNYRAVSNDPMPADVVEWARWYGTTYPGLFGNDLARMVEQIDADRAEVARTDALLADFAAA